MPQGRSARKVAPPSAGRDDAFRSLSGRLLSTASWVDRSVRRLFETGRKGGLLSTARELYALVRKRRPLLDLARWRRTLGLVRQVLAADERTATRGAFTPGTLGVRPSPIGPGELAPTVLDVPQPEIDEFLDRVVGRYVRTLRTHWPRAALEAWRQGRLAPVDDREFAALLAEGAFSRFLDPRLEPADRSRFAAALAGVPARARLHKVDLAAVERVATYRGIHAAPTCTLLADHGRPGGARPLAITVRGLLLTPRDGPAWELAKYFVLQGAALSLIAGLHPTVHFPMDAINAITKAELAPTHPVRRLLEPHLYMQLPLDYAVLYIGRSVAHNDQREIYTPFPGPKEGFFSLMGAYYQGIPGNRAYPAYRYPLDPPAIESGYGRALAAYHRVVLAFVRRVLAGVAADDPDLVRWAERIAAQIPGFPDGKRLAEADTLARALATFVWTVSVVHSADHHAYAALPLDKVPLRLRRPPPTGRRMRSLDRSALVRWEDLFRHHMAREMYFKPTVLRGLGEVEYSFPESVRQRAAARFREDLEALAATLGTDFVPLDQIAASIQF